MDTSISFNIRDFISPCPKCGVMIDNPYTPEEIQSGQDLEFTCSKCGYSYCENIDAKMRKYISEIIEKKYKEHGDIRI